MMMQFLPTNMPLKINPGDIEILNNIGIVYAGEKQHYTAIEYFESALNIEKK